MKKLIFCIALVSSSLMVNGQTRTVERPNEKTPVAANNAEYKAENPGWYVNLDEAYLKSKETGKPIMVNFTGSDWCGWCKRLTASVFVKDEFKAWAEDNVVLVEADFPRRKQLPADIKKQNAGLQQAFKVQGFPTVWVFDLDKDATTGKYSISAIGKTGYTPTVEQFTSGIDQMLARAEQAK